MLGKVSFFIGISLVLHTPFDLQLVIYSVLLSGYFITSNVG